MTSSTARPPEYGAIVDSPGVLEGLQSRQLSTSMGLCFFMDEGTIKSSTSESPTHSVHAPSSTEERRTRTTMPDEWGHQLEQAQTYAEVVRCVAEYARSLTLVEQVDEFVSEPVAPGEQPVNLIALKSVADFLLTWKSDLADPDIASGPNGEIGLSWWPVSDGIVSMMFEGSKPRLSAVFPRSTPQEPRQSIGPEEIEDADEAVSKVRGLLRLMSPQ